MKIKIILLSLFIGMIYSCDSGKKIGTSLSGNSTNTTGGTIGDPAIGGAISCTGTASDGYADQSNNDETPNPFPLYQYEVNLAGTKGWMVGNSPVDNAADLEQAFQALSNDGSYYIRLKMRESVRPPTNEEFCPGRVTNIAWMYHYSKLQFSIYRHSYAVKFDENFQVVDYQALTGQGGVYLTSTELVKSGNCSNVIKIPPLNIGTMQEGYTAVTLFEVKTSRSDAQCKYCQERGGCASVDVENFYCPAFDVRPADCWSAIVQVSTNRTQFFRGSKRADY